MEQPAHQVPSVQDAFQIVEGPSWTEPMAMLEPAEPPSEPWAYVLVENLVCVCVVCRGSLVTFVVLRFLSN